MAKKAMTYKGHKIYVVDIHDRKHLFINSEHIRSNLSHKKNDYWSPHLPYQAFSTLHDLGKAIIDYRTMDQKKPRAADKSKRVAKSSRKKARS